MQAGSMKWMLLVLAFAISSVRAGTGDEPVGFAMWSAERIEAAADRLEGELGDKVMVYEVIGNNYKDHSMYLVLRGKTGLAEFHETESDYQISFRGTATHIIGGKLVDPWRLVDAEQRPRKQLRARSIQEGQSSPLKPGDIIHVPPATPHQLIIEPGKPYMYILIKLNEEPGRTEG